MAGRKPIPTRMKILRGNPGKRALPANEPRPTAGIPKMPSKLSSRARRAWRSIGPELDRMGVLTVADGTALELLCDAYAEWKDARQVVIVDGATYETVSKHGKMTRTRPEVAIAADAWRRIAVMLREFGLTPSSRTKVEAAPTGAREDNPFADLGATA